jgi:hypothetical protein
VGALSLDPSSFRFRNMLARERLTTDSPFTLGGTSTPSPEGLLEMWIFWPRFVVARCAGFGSWLRHWPGISYALAGPC